LSLISVTSPLFSHRSFSLNVTPPPAIYTLSLHDALPILGAPCQRRDPGYVRAGHAGPALCSIPAARYRGQDVDSGRADIDFRSRSEEHTSELQSLTNLVCRLLLEKKKKSAM